MERTIQIKRSDLKKLIAETLNEQGPAGHSVGTREVVKNALEIADENWGEFERQVKENPHAWDMFMGVVEETLKTGTDYDYGDIRQALKAVEKKYSDKVN
jgi:hypothetical protein